jgi:hypothetical protein
MIETPQDDMPLKQLELIPMPPDWKSHWKGMPEFAQGQQREYAKIIVRFRSQQDLDEFCKLIGQKLNKNSQCTWHPELRPDKTVTRKYVDEP